MMADIVMSGIERLTLARARAMLQARQVSSRELTEAFLARIDEANPALNTYVALTREHALAMAQAADERLARAGSDGGDTGLLEGIPVAVKDLFATRDIHTQACSRILEGFRPVYESTVTANLWADGAVLLGKTNMDEFAMGSSNEHSCYGPAINPWRRTGEDTALSPGGSSGGSAAAVAADLCLGATATDTGGSIRQPAALTGTVGMKPTYGRCSRRGIIAFASSLDQAGPITRTVRDNAILLRSMASHDARDATSIDRPVPDYEAAIGRSVRDLVIGIPREYRTEGMAHEIEDLWQKGIAWLEGAGAQIVDISLPHTRYALPVYYIIAPAEASSNLARYDGVRYGLRVEREDIVDMYEATRAAGFGEEVKRRLMIGTYVLSSGYYDAYYLRAQKVRSLVRQDFHHAFTDAGVHAVLTPTAPNTAFAAGQIADPVEMYLNDIFTVSVNLAGLPAISVPAGLSHDGLPLALQLVGPHFAEERLFQLGAVIEEAAGHFVPGSWWKGRPPASGAQ